MLSRIKNILTPTATKVGLLATFFILFLYTMGIPFFHMMELKAFDLHFTTRGKIGTGNDIVIVAIDEKSINDIGRWPWSRTYIAELIERLDSFGTKVTAFDVIFSEPDESSGISALRDLKKKLGNKADDIVAVIEESEKKADNDGRLASVIRSSASTILGYFYYLGNEEVASLTADEKAKEAYPIPSKYGSVRYLEEIISEPEFIEAKAVEENIKALSMAASNFGYFNIIPDYDGTVRWAPLVIKYGDNFYPHLSIEVVKKYLDLPSPILNIASYGVDSIQLGDMTLPTDESGRLLINYRGPQKTFPHYSASDVINGKLSAEIFKDKIVLVGATAIGIYDMRVIPFPGPFPGLEIHANIIDNILQADYLNRPEWLFIFDLLVILISGAFLSAFLPRFKPLYGTFFTIALTGSYIYFNGYTFNNLKVWLTAIYPVITIIFVSACVTTFRYVTEEKKKKEIKDAFSRYVAPSLVQEVLKDPKLLSLGGEEKRLTVLFSDIRGFTNISESLEPQALVKLMNDYLTPMTEVVLKDNGTVDKYMGDAIMAFWGAPVWQEDHAVRACKAALHMLKKLAELQEGWEKEGIPRIDIGIGLSTGKLTVGNMGSNTRFDYTVMGDTVNLGSRIEGINKVYGTRVIVSEGTYHDVKGKFVLRMLDNIKVKGKGRPVKIYELMAEKSDDKLLPEIARRFEGGLKLYMARDWDKAIKYFRGVLQMKKDDAPARLFLSRIKRLRELDLPDNWDGVFVMKTK